MVSDRSRKCQQIWEIWEENVANKKKGAECCQSHSTNKAKPTVQHRKDKWPAFSVRLCPSGRQVWQAWSSVRRAVLPGTVQGGSGRVTLTEGIFFFLYITATDSRRAQGFIHLHLVSSFQLQMQNEAQVQAIIVWSFQVRQNSADFKSNIKHNS